MTKIKETLVMAAAGAAFGLGSSAMAGEPVASYDLTGCTSDNQTAQARFVLTHVDGQPFTPPSPDTAAAVKKMFAGVVAKYTGAQYESEDAGFIRDINAAIEETGKKIGFDIGGGSAGTKPGCTPQ